ncbi:MAG: hypothetical protein ACREUQ_14780 [Burkholderiales bacterium]
MKPTSISLDDISITPNVREAWHRLSRQAALKLAGKGIAQAEIGDEQAEVNPDSTLTIYATARGERLAEMRVAPGQWSYAPKPPMPKMDFGQILEVLERTEPELWTICYPRIYRDAGRYGSPKAQAAGYATAASWMRDHQMNAPATVRNIYLAACQARQFNFPTLFLASDLLAAISETDAPGDTDWRGIKLPYPAGVLMLPQGALNHPANGAIDFIGWARIEAETTLSFDRDYPAVKTEHDIFITWTGLRQALNYPLHDTVLNASTHPTIGGQPAAGVHTTPTREGIFELPLAVGEQEFLAQCRQLVFNVLLALDARPQLAGSPGRKVGATKKGARREIWEPTIVGRDYRIVRARSGEAGTHASPRLHWRRGHYRNQAYGPGRTQHRRIWLEPVLVGAGED